MDLYNEIENTLMRQQEFTAWPAMQLLFHRVATGLPEHWRLPLIAGEASGGTPEKIIPAAAALACLHISIMLVDDLLDDDPRGEYRRVGAAAAANLALAFQAAGLDVIAHSGAKPQVKLAALESLNRMAFKTALGQELDSHNPADEASYWQVTQAKSSPFFGAALQVGALFGEASIEIAGQLRLLGDIYGVMIQIQDDLNDSLANPANSDWIQGRSPLPILFAQVVDHPDRERFLDLRKQILDPDKLIEAQTILIRCGAIGYCIDRLLHYKKEADTLLKTIPLANPSGVETLFDTLIQPVQKLLNSLAGYPSILPSSV